MEMTLSLHCFQHDLPFIGQAFILNLLLGTNTVIGPELQKKINKLKTPTSWQLIVNNKRLLQCDYDLGQYWSHQCIQKGSGRHAFIDAII